MEVITFDEANKDFETVFNTILNNAGMTVITQQEKKPVIIIPLSTYNSLMETFYLLKSVNNSEHLRKSIEQFKLLNNP
ncbi:type II toxin-antitoxin system Phd/YefM family antitoxin [Providencia rustigianii]|uniref:type II toxin-antitoxin system Phd/YefM family antitoxin n=1 Tax=Providencia rustigianii TaxID=158850 RepID=UPI00390698FA